MKIKRLNQIICYLIEFFYLLKYNINISGHKYVEDDDGRLTCIRCGYKNIDFEFVKIAKNAIKCYYCGKIFYIKDMNNINIKHIC